MKMNFSKMVGTVALRGPLFFLILLAASARADFACFCLGNANGGTNNISATATNTYTNLWWDASGYTTVGFAVNYNFTLAPVGVTPSVPFLIQRSIDNTNWESQGPLLVFTANGATNNCTALTNFTVGGTPFYRIFAAQNTNSAAVTNLQISVSLKR